VSETGEGTVAGGVRRRWSWQRTAATLTFFGAVLLLGVFGYQMAANAGWLQGGRAATGAPGVFTSGQLAPPPFRAAPDFELQLFSGETLRLSDLRGRPVVVNFWASWCPPCRDEAPVLEGAWQEYRAKGVVFVGVDIWDTDGDARRFLSEYGVSYPNGMSPKGEEPVAVGYGLTGIPETYFIDREGNVARKWIGPLDEDSLRQLLDETLAADK
jgi:cytochrome c biogenesis protein CcmG/thiol:disulfide interchange protein DsbE